MVFSVADVQMYLRFNSKLEEMFMIWRKLKSQQHDCHAVKRLSEYTGNPCNKIHTSVVPFRLFMSVNNHGHIYIACGILILIATMK